MFTSQMSEVIQYIRRAVPPGGGVGMTDGQLLESYILRRDESAFAALVQRHAPMVWRVCRRVLASHQDAEDAFQATFLVFVRKASSVEPREMVANWLYGVAHQTARKAQAMGGKRRSRERQVKEMPEPQAARKDVWADLQPLLDAELSLLPEAYRAVVVLCDLEGKTRKEAAQELRLPEGTIASRLARGRVLLVKQLGRHDLALSSEKLAAALSQGAASASVPGGTLVASTINAANRLAVGQAAGAGVSAEVAALTEGVLKTMLLCKLKTAMVVVFGLALLVGGLGLAGYQIQAADRPGAKKAAEKSPPPVRDTPVALRKARLDAARNAYEVVWRQYGRGLGDEEQVYRWSLRLLQAERETAGRKAQVVAALKGHLRRVKELEKTAPDRLVAEGLAPGKFLVDKSGKRVLLHVGNSPRSDVSALTAFYRAEAEVWLAEAKAN